MKGFPADAENSRTGRGLLVSRNLQGPDSDGTPKHPPPAITIP